MAPRPHLCGNLPDPVSCTLRPESTRLCERRTSAMCSRRPGHQATDHPSTLSFRCDMPCHDHRSAGLTLNEGRYYPRPQQSPAKELPRCPSPATRCFGTSPGGTSGPSSIIVLYEPRKKCIKMIFSGTIFVRAPPVTIPASTCRSCGDRPSPWPYSRCPVSDPPAGIPGRTGFPPS